MEGNGLYLWLETGCHQEKIPTDLEVDSKLSEEVTALLVFLSEKGKIMQNCSVEAKYLFWEEKACELLVAYSQISRTENLTFLALALRDAYHRYLEWADLPLKESNFLAFAELRTSGYDTTVWTALWEYRLRLILLLQTENCSVSCRRMR